MDSIRGYAEMWGDGRAALVKGDRVVTWAELDRRANQVARALASRGIGPGDRVAAGLRNSVEFFEIVAGAGRLGATVLPLSFRLKRDETEYLVGDSAARVIIAEPANADEYQGFTDVIYRGEPYEQWVGSFEDTALDAQAGTQLATLRYYTSGTTGRPKAIVRRDPDPSRAAALEEILQARLGVVANPGEVHLLCAVVYHTAPGAYSCIALGMGHTIVIMDHFDAEESLELIQRHKVTWTQMAPIHLVRITALPDDVRGRYDLSSMKRLLHAGAPCPVDVKWKALGMFPPGVVYEYYAATEGYATECTDEDWKARPGTVGRPMGGIRISILDDDGHELPAGEVGLVYIDNGNRFEYDGAPDKTRETWRGDSFSVGDMGYLDEEGFLFLTDRKTHMIITGGANVYPAEVENVLFSHPAVADACVIGVPDEEFGEQVKAVVELRAPATADELIEYCRDGLAHYKCPKSVDFVDTMPRDPNGKIKKRELRDPYWAGHATRI
jgi:long-chain acyl-CoA synthetase